MSFFRKSKKKIQSLLGIFTVLIYSSQARCEFVEFDSDRWELKPGSTVEQYLDHKSLKGSATLKDLEFGNGIIELDVAFEGGRCYPGVNFRIESAGNNEQFYIRPHRTKQADALQYTPVFNGLNGWQLYNGEGFTAVADIPYQRWLHIKLVVSGKQAWIYLDNADSPALIITDLKHGVSKGAVGVFGPVNGQAHFANFKVEVNDDLTLETPPYANTPPGVIRDWSLSQSFKLSQIDFEQYPDEKLAATINWQKVKSEPGGLLDIARFEGRKGPGPDCVYAKTTIKADEEHRKQITFGYSDAISIFCNGEILFTGVSAYRQRDPSFLGIVGLFDAVYLPLQKGDNELVLLVAETFGGWGFMCRDEKAIFLDSSLHKKWEQKNGFNMPESVVYDPTRNVLAGHSPFPIRMNLRDMAPLGHNLFQNSLLGVKCRKQTGCRAYQNQLVWQSSGISSLWWKEKMWSKLTWNRVRFQTDMLCPSQCF
ncbi:hypothetical protein ACFL27_19075 [candidate division CSSED10-310 bacterium]|uniref:3-keto-disaccharide hydrolase domain-containing protein n=1 Tax=candidate division CSSED10-310 bacterium TaxID=2855610 RepID=A0ABV6Z1I4_UNCC1